MKEARYFYVPDAPDAGCLPSDEAAHAVRVLRLAAGDEIFLIDGQGSFFRAEVTMTSARQCCYAILETMPAARLWNGRIHLAMAPTKMIDRVEWMAEKATEIGFDALTFLECRFSERRTVKTERVERIVVSAMKQSRKAWKPVVNGMVDFQRFVKSQHSGARFIAHCYEEIAREDLHDSLCQLPADYDDDVVVMVGPEGDFSIEEVRMAIQEGFQSVSLGKCRLRTETAALYAVMMAQLRLRR